MADRAGRLGPGGPGHLQDGHVGALNAICAKLGIWIPRLTAFPFGVPVAGGVVDVPK